MRPLYSIHLSTAKTWRGGENQIFLLAQGLLKRGQKTLVVAPKGSPLLERSAEAGIPTHALKVREIDPLGLIRLIKLVRKEKPDILHLHDGHAVLPGQLAGRTLPTSKLKVIAHRRTVFKLKGKWKYAGRVNRVIAISEAAKQTLQEGGILPERISVVYSGLDFSAQETAHAAGQQLRESLKLKPEDTLIVHAAALTREKRHEDMLHVVARLNASLKENNQGNVHLALAGSGSEDQNLRSLARSLGVDGCVHFLGFLRDVTPLWAAGSIAFYASEAEGLCTALIEAQAAALPAVVTRAGGMVEVVEEGITGFAAPIGDVAGLTEALKRLCLDAALREKMGAVARERARKLFSADAMVDGIARVYEDVWR
jgi:glycosyltransferase involved in cell wall biosynthesis